MATLLDIGLFQHFSVVFSFLLVFAIVYSALLYLKLFGKETDKGISALIALAVSSLFLFSPSLVSLVNFLAPWFVVLILLIFFVVLLYRFAGAPQESIVNAMKSWGSLHWFIIVLVLIIVLAGIGQIYGPGLAELTSGGNDTVVVEDGVSTAPQNFSDKIWSIIFHPKVLGLIFILIIASFVIRLMAGERS